jgi:hypothetical protein
MTHKHLGYKLITIFTHSKLLLVFKFNFEQHTRYKSISPASHTSNYDRQFFYRPVQQVVNVLDKFKSTFCDCSFTFLKLYYVPISEHIYSFENRSSTYAEFPNKC